MWTPAAVRASCSKRAKAIKGKEQTQTNGELTDNALGEIRRGEAKFPDAFSSEVLKAMAAHLCPDLKLGQTREVLIRKFAFRETLEESIVKLHEEISHGQIAIKNGAIPPHGIQLLANVHGGDIYAAGVNRGLWKSSTSRLGTGGWCSVYQLC